MYICENVDKLESYRSRMKIENCYPEENELPLIYVESRGVKKLICRQIMVCHIMMK